jgi:hypothetical protein
MCGSTPKVATPEKLPEAPTMPEQRSSVSTADRDKRRRRAASAGGGLRGTILGGGVSNAGAPKTLLGQ